MTVEPAKAAAKIEHHGESYYFCSRGCAGKFANRRKYAAGSRREGAQHYGAPTMDSPADSAARMPAAASLGEHHYLTPKNLSSPPSLQSRESSKSSATSGSPGSASSRQGFATPARCTRRSYGSVRALSHLRDGARAHGPVRRTRSRSRVRFHAPSIVDQRRAVATRSGSSPCSAKSSVCISRPRSATGSNSSSPRRSCCGAVGLFFNVFGHRSFTAAQTCLR